MKFSKDQVAQFFELPVWKEIESRLQADLAKAEDTVELPDPFAHGMAVGKRRTLKTILKMQEILTAEAEGRSPYGHKGNLR